jgi:hypothetical protein
MGFKRWGYTFAGAFETPASLARKSGVYVIWDKNGDNWRVLDIGETSNVQKQVKNHGRAKSWQINCYGTMYYSAIYTPTLLQRGRMQIEQYLREQENPPCGRTI